MTDALSKFQNLPPDTLDKPSVFDLAEFQVLRQFFESWETLHSIPNDKWHKKQKEDAAQKMVEKAIVLRHMKSEKQIVLVPRFAR